MSTGLRIACIGECMVEMQEHSQSLYSMTFGGDSANTAVYLARVLRNTKHKVDYITALGDDPYSDQMMTFLTDEGVGMDKVAQLQGQMPGLYFIRTDDAGERSFYYYRSAAAARSMFLDSSGQALLKSVAGYDWVYVTGISLSILDEAQRAALIDTLTAARKQGLKVAFDGNYRPRGWPNIDTVRRTFTDFLGITDMAMVTFGDEQAVHGDATPQACLTRLRRAGVGEGAIKLDRLGCLAFNGDGAVNVPVTRQIATPVDTTAAGDSFNAAYLASRIRGLSPDAAGHNGNTLAGTVIQHKGAVIPSASMPDLVFE